MGKKILIENLKKGHNNFIKKKKNLLITISIFIKQTQ